jgi:hypothetical protein
MGLVLTATAGLCLWIIMWALNVGGFDSILIAVGMILIALALGRILPHLPGRQDNS